MLTTADTPRSRHRTWLTLILVAWMGGQIGCRAPDQTTVDLADLLPVARIFYETPEIPIGTGHDGLWLRDGWGVASTRADGKAFRWITAESASIEVWLGQPRDLEVVWVGWPLNFPGSPEQSLRFEANGESLGELTMARGWQPEEYRVAWPQSAQQPGLNTLRVIPSNRHVPADVVADSNDPRSLSAAWTAIRFEGSAFGGEPKVRERTTQPTLVLPAGSRIEVFVRPEGAARFELDGLTQRGGDPSTGAMALRVSILPDQGSETHDDLAPGDSRSVALPVTGEPVRVALQAVSADGAGALQLVAPRLTFEEAPAAPAADQPDPETEPAEHQPWNVLIYLVDSLRADHLGCYGYDRPTSPEIDRFAADAVRFDHVVAQASWTRAAVASVLTGLYPHAHGAVGREDQMAASTPYLAEILGDVGYASAGFVTNGNVSEPFGFARGFETYRHYPERNDIVEHHVLSDALNDEVFAWLDARDAERPFFLYVHTSDPHYPYRPPSPYLEEFASDVADPSVGDLDAVVRLIRRNEPADAAVRQDLIDLYDGEIAFNDHHFGRLLNRLEDDGLYDRTVIVFVGDHGEEFLDHGSWGHGATLYGEQLRVPLIIRLPEGRGRGRVIPEPVRQIDILPTILDALGQPVPLDVQGQSRWARMVDGSEAADATADESSFAELHLDGEDADAIIDGHYKLILDGSGGRAELFDLRTDAAEAHDLAAERPALTGYLRALLMTRRVTAAQRAVGREAADIDPELRSRLEALGYLN